ncbi:xanthine dehydrogenase family protein molybdopterin-binding subunit [Flavivirga rizhaonensis]|uniref:Xanthine dehydrogenase family protein molybdopterin-binding subunit n=1 Tax=Flavivirga rizhaonensis TaxID=2559571 RepID=A0A4S1DRU2_9FLAO|nr:molybdopterin cofactor-binding domain-containing protein [Flavivirga rizhaonensis]TGV00641.1 xanthine dehydrogenase family protein molybdopterin-binding subunit [Flavivirga rizhaonensis]
MTPSKQITFSRRSFLKTSTLASGGMLIGFNLFNACKPEAKVPIDLSQLNYNDFNAYIKISKEGKVTIFSPNPEIGQGVKTSMPMIIAEELDVAWEDVYVVQAPLDTENYTRQVAGGSQSIRFSWQALRQTGATAKQMLVNAAAAKWGVDASECSVAKGIITNAKGEKLGYGDVVLEAAALEVPENVTLKAPKDFTIIGKGAGNVDIDKIVTGKPLFGLDYKEEGMLYASVLRPPAFGQVLESFDDIATRALPGVVDVIVIGEKARAYLEGSKKKSWTAQLSKSDKVVVIAKTTWDAIKGKRAIKAIWKNDSELESTESHDKLLLDLLEGETFKTRRKDGNVKKAFANADKVLERIYESPFLPHNCMEPMNFFANVTSEKVHLVGPVQTPAEAAKVVSGLLDRKLEDIHIEMTRMGGGFGRRLYGDFVYEVAEISNAIKKPVKMVSTREDDMTTGVYRPATKYKIAASIKDGKLTGYHLKEASINGNMYGLIPNFFPAAALENYQVDTANYKSNITTGAWRAPYTNFLASAEQSFFDELAEVLEVDRVQLHLDLLENVKKNPEPNIEYSPERLQGVIKKVVDKSNWGKTEAGVYQGFSVYYCHNTHVAEVADIIMDNGSPIVKKVTCAVDCGIVVNPLGAMNQIKGGVIDGIGHAMYSDFGFNNGVPQSNNFSTYQLIRMAQTPKVDVHFIENDIDPTGLGEPTLPPVGAAVANAIYKATGKRLTKQPYMSNLDLEKVVG